MIDKVESGQDEYKNQKTACAEDKWSEIVPTRYRIYADIILTSGKRPFAVPEPVSLVIPVKLAENRHRRGGAYQRRVHPVKVKLQKKPMAHPARQMRVFALNRRVIPRLIKKKRGEKQKNQTAENAGRFLFGTTAPPLRMQNHRQVP